MTDYSKRLLYTQNPLHPTITQRLQQGFPEPTLTSRCITQIYRLANYVISINKIQSVITTLTFLFPRARRYLDPPALWINGLEKPNLASIRTGSIPQLDVPISRIINDTKNLIALLLRTINTNQTNFDYTTIRSLLDQLETLDESYKQLNCAYHLIIKINATLNEHFDIPNRDEIIFQATWLAEAIPTLLTIVEASQDLNNHREITPKLYHHMAVDLLPNNYHTFLTKSINPILKNTERAIAVDLAEANRVHSAIFRESLICDWLLKIEMFKNQQVSTEDLLPPSTIVLQNIKQNLDTSQQLAKHYKDQISVSSSAIHWIHFAINHVPNNQPRPLLTKHMSTADKLFQELLPTNRNDDQNTPRCAFLIETSSALTTTALNKLRIKMPLSTLQPWLMHMYSRIELSLTQLRASQTDYSMQNQH